MRSAAGLPRLVWPTTERSARYHGADAATRGVERVWVFQPSTLSRQPGDSIETVDQTGQTNLVDAAERAGVSRFVLISFPQMSLDFPLQPTFFTEVWLSPALGFDAANATAQIYGSGQNRISWISFRDVAAFAVAALDNPRAANAVIKLGGPEALSPLEVVQLAERSVGKPIAVQHVPEDALRGQFQSATDSVQKSFAALMLSYAAGDVIEMADTLRAFPGQQLKSVREHFQASI